MPVEFATFHLPGGAKCMRMEITGFLSKEDGDLMLRTFGPGGPLEGLPRLCISLKQTGVSSEVRKMFSTREAKEPWAALVVTNPLVRVATNFVARVNKSLRLKMFSNEEDAVRWLDERTREESTHASSI